MILSVTAAVTAFLTAVIIAPFTIKYLHRLKFGQEIREIGPSWHKKKSGTPTMGGIIIIAGLLAAVAVTYKYITLKTVIVLLCSLGFGAVGFIDDYIKVVMKRNLGLTSVQKFMLQTVVAVVFVLTGLHTGILSTNVFIPFTKGYSELGLLYIPFALFVVLGTVNSVNLTDGIDGLATSVTAIVMIFFCFALRKTQSLEIFSCALVGALLAFFLFNKNPARVFMGDTGSLFLGGAVASLAIISGNPLILILTGFVYFAETLSVIIQVTSFKLTGKRVFKMSPIHHHFEMCGWNEKKIVLVFSTLTAVLSLASLFASLH